MFGRIGVCAAATLLFALGIAPAAAQGGQWQSAEIVTFNDFDDLQVNLDGKAHKAFLVGLRPIRETIEGKEQQERAREAPGLS
jgi:hypothetical protein